MVMARLPGPLPWEASEWIGTRRRLPPEEVVMQTPACLLMLMQQRALVRTLEIVLLR